MLWCISPEMRGAKTFKTCLACCSYWSILVCSITFLLSVRASVPYERALWIAVWCLMLSKPYGVPCLHLYTCCVGVKPGLCHWLLKTGWFGHLSVPRNWSCKDLATQYMELVHYTNRISPSRWECSDNKDSFRVKVSFRHSIANFYSFINCQVKGF